VHEERGSPRACRTNGESRSEGADDWRSISRLGNPTRQAEEVREMKILGPTRSKRCSRHARETINVRIRTAQKPVRLETRESAVPAPMGP